MFFALYSIQSIVISLAITAFEQCIKTSTSVAILLDG